MEERTCPSMLPPALPRYQLNHMVMTRTIWLLCLLRKMGRVQLYHLWPYSIQLHCIFHPEKSTQVLVRVFSGVASELMLLHHCYQSWLQFEVVCIHSSLSNCRIFFLNDGPLEILHCVSNRRPSGCCPLLLCLVMSYICHGCALCSFSIF